MFGVKQILEERGHQVVPFAINYAKNCETPYARYFAAPADSSKRFKLLQAVLAVSPASAPALESLPETARTPEERRAAANENMAEAGLDRAKTAAEIKKMLAESATKRVESALKVMA